jgi:hypothetical protein
MMGGMKQRKVEITLPGGSIMVRNINAWSAGSAVCTIAESYALPSGSILRCEMFAATSDNY